MVASLRPHVTDRPHATAVADLAGATPWVVLDDRANRWIWALRGIGVQPGERVAVMTGNRREAWEVYLACLHAGWVLVPVPFDADSERVAFMLSDCSARALIVEELTRTTAVAAARANPYLPLFTLDGPTGTDRVRASAELLAGVPSAEPDGQQAGGPMFYTSGTTGTPKGVVSAGSTTVGDPVESLGHAAAGLMQGLQLPVTGCAMIVGPSYHSGQFVLATSPLLAGQTLVVRRRPDPAEILRTIDTFGVTNTLLLPADLAALLRLSEVQRARFNGSSLRLVLHGGAPCPPAVRSAMIDWMGRCVTEYYGATEGGLFAISTADDFRTRPGSVGRILPSVECRIIGPDDADVAVGEEGAVYMRHRSGARFSYHGSPEKTAQAHLPDGWFTVGDVGWMDGEGYLHVSGRSSHVITVGGRWVHPGRVEGAAVEVAGVRDAGAFGGQDGQVLHLALVAEDGVDGGTLDGPVRTHLETRLGAASVPSHVHLLDHIPRSAAGKILREELAAMVDRGAVT